MFLNAGDSLYRTDSLRQMVATIERHPDADYVGGSFCFQDKDGCDNIIPVAQDPSLSFSAIETGFFDHRYPHGIPNHQATLIRRSILSQIPYELDFVVSADIRQYARAWKAGYRKWAVAPVVCSRFVFGGMSSQKRFQLLHDQRRLMLDITKNPNGVNRWIRDGIRLEMRVQRWDKFKWKEFWPTLKAFPMTTWRAIVWYCYWKLLDETFDSKELAGAKSYLFINLTDRVNFGKCFDIVMAYSPRMVVDSRAGVTYPKAQAAFSSPPECAGAIGAVLGEVDVENLELLLQRKSIRDDTCVIVVADRERITKGLKARLYDCGVRHFYVPHGKRVAKINNPKPVILGFTKDNQVIYK